jgi:hypothetical protein
MEQNFQTSFIPKKPMIEERAVARRPIGALVIISILIFLTMILASGGLYFYKGVLTQNITKMESDLNLAKNRFEPAKISQLQLLDRRLNASSQILSKHIAISPVFQALESLTMKTVRYTKFDYSFVDDKNPANNKIIVNMSGQAIGYRSIALQADLFSKNKNLIDPVFSNLSLDNKGNVLFDLVFSVDANFVDYKQMLKTESSNSSSVGTITNTGTSN